MFVCVFQVNQENVVKVGHRQVVNMIRQGGNRLIIKVVTVTRNLDLDDTTRKKGSAPYNTNSALQLPVVYVAKGLRTPAAPDILQESRV